MSDQPFVPADFVVPEPLVTEQFRLEPLGPQHNAEDYAAWTSSVEHIEATPGFAGRGWPHPMELADNLRDLEGHAQDFSNRRGFTYTVISTGAGEIIGCVYIYPPRGESPGGSAGERRANVSSWVRADHAPLDPELYRTVLAWLERDWPFTAIEYAPRS
jgi:hypothetical protein